MVLSIGHACAPIDKKSVRYRVFVRPDCEGCLDRVEFAIEEVTGMQKTTVRARR